jgi:hypothetical protein
LHLTEQERGPICILRAAITAIRQRPEDACQSSFKFDPVSASNFGSDSLLMQFEGCLAF